MRIELDSELKYRVADDEGAEPLVFSPHVNWTGFTEPNIIDAY